MTAQTDTRRRPTGLIRAFFRAPIYLYRAGFGWLLNGRFLLLNHIGRKTGKARQAVLEVVEHDEATDTYYVASGYGRSSHWFKNIEAAPDVTIQVGRRKLAVTAEILSPEVSGQKMVEYARRMPVAAENLSKLIGLEVDGTEAGYRRLGREEIPFVAFRPRYVIDESPEPTQIALLVLVIILGLWWVRRRR